MKRSLIGSGMTSLRTQKRMIDRLRAQGIKDERVLAAMEVVPRHLFVDQALAHRAYEDTALPLILGQTISQPYIVARMIEILFAGRAALGKTLEIGAGCGYQAAVLAALTQPVYAVERMAPLLELAHKNLQRAQVTLTRLKHADGMMGLPQEAPFDTIIVAAAAVETPPALLEQLAYNGRLLLPCNVNDESAHADSSWHISRSFHDSEDVHQILRQYTRTSVGYTQQQFDAVKFVPLLPGVI